MVYGKELTLRWSHDSHLLKFMSLCSSCVRVGGTHDLLITSNIGQSCWDLTAVSCYTCFSLPADSFCCPAGLREPGCRVVSCLSAWQRRGGSLSALGPSSQQEQCKQSASPSATREWILPVTWANVEVNSLVKSPDEKSVYRHFAA